MTQTTERPELCRCGLPESDPAHVSHYVTGLPGHAYAPPEREPALWDLPIFGWAWSDDGKDRGA